MRLPPTSVLRTTLSGPSVAYPMIAASFPSGVALMALRTSSAISGTTPMTHLPSFPMLSGSIPRSSQALTTPSLRGMSEYSISMPMCDFPHHSLSVLANPPLVGSFIATIPPAFRPWAIILFSGATSLWTSLSNPYPSRKERRAMPWSPMYPETMMASPGFTLESVHQRCSTGRYSLALARSASR